MFSEASSTVVEIIPPGSNSTSTTATPLEYHENSTIITGLMTPGSNSTLTDFTPLDPLDEVNEECLPLLNMWWLVLISIGGLVFSLLCFGFVLAYARTRCSLDAIFASDIEKGKIRSISSLPRLILFILYFIWKTTIEEL